MSPLHEIIAQLLGAGESGQRAAFAAGGLSRPGLKHQVSRAVAKLPAPLADLCQGLARGGLRYYRRRKALRQTGHFRQAWISRPPWPLQPPPSQPPLRVVQYITDLSAGGAERQLCLLASGLHERGARVRVLTTSPPRGELAHHLPLLQGRGLEARQAGDRDPGPGHGALARAVAARKDLLLLIPDYLRGPVWGLFGELVLDPPHVLHCWLDYPGIFGGLAGMLAEVPSLVIGARNLALDRFPHAYQPWSDPWLGVVLQVGGARLVNNSRAGARDYARWLGLAGQATGIIPNASAPDPGQVPVEAASQRLREELDLPAGAPLLLGVFRLSPEKRPLDFLRVAQELCARHAGLHVLLAGVGPLEQEMRAALPQQGRQGRIRLLGRRGDVADLMAASRALLLCSQAEGMPNVVLEAQALGLPVVATRAGGVPECVDEGRSAYLHEVGDLAGLSASLERILEDPELGQRMGRAGREWVRGRFSEASMVQAHLDIYRAEA